MNKRSSNEPSPFVEGILHPIRSFFGVRAPDGGGERLRDDLLATCASDAFDGACKRYGLSLRVYSSFQPDHAHLISDTPSILRHGRRQRNPSGESTSRKSPHSRYSGLHVQRRTTKRVMMNGSGLR
jgi:hypothetical protein